MEVENTENTNKQPNASAELEVIRKELLHFASLINHDFKEPVRTITAFSTLLGKRLDVDDHKSHELLYFIEDGAKRMHIMIEGLVEYLRAEEYIDALKSEDMGEIFGDVLKLEAKLIKEKQAQVVIENELPKVICAATSIKTLVKHILRNALYFQKEEPLPVIRISSERKKDVYWVHIEDNGIGVAKAMENQIFLPFRRLNAIGTYKGCGLGLATCQKIIQANKGSIHATSLEEGGLRLSFSLPALPNA